MKTLARTLITTLIFGLVLSVSAAERSSTSALVAQRERELISERTRLGMAAAKTKGVKLGTPNPEKAVAAMLTANKSAKVEFAAKVFPIIEEIKSAGVQTLRGICDCLNRRGISTRNGKNWYPATVRNILKLQNA